MSRTATLDHPLEKSTPATSQAESGTPIEPTGIGPAVVNRIESEIALETAVVANMTKIGDATVVIATEETEQSAQTGTQSETVTVTGTVVETATAIGNVTETAVAEIAKETANVPVVIDPSLQMQVITLPTPEPGVSNVKQTIARTAMPRPLHRSQRRRRILTPWSEKRETVNASNASNNAANRSNLATAATVGKNVRGPAAASITNMKMSFEM